MRNVFLLLIVLSLMFLVSCAAGSNDLVGTIAIEVGKPAGFWWGLWQVMISPITFIISLFTENVSIYEVHNNGNWYDFGFFLGLMAAFGSSGGTASRRR